jgi:hypothetical protein
VKQAKVGKIFGNLFRMFKGLACIEEDVLLMDGKKSCLEKWIFEAALC